MHLLLYKLINYNYFKFNFYNHINVFLINSFIKKLSRNFTISVYDGSYEGYLASKAEEE